MTQQGYPVPTRRFRALSMFVPLCTLISLFYLGCAQTPKSPGIAPVKKVVEKKGIFVKHWKVNPGEAEMLYGKPITITWKAVGAQLTILNPHKELFEGGVQVLVIPKDQEGSLTVSSSAPQREYLYAIFCHDGTGEFAKGSDPKIIIR